MSLRRDPPLTDALTTSARSFSAPAFTAVKWAVTAVGMVVVSYGVWRLWAHPDSSSGRWVALGAFLLLAAEVWASGYVSPIAEWTVAGARATLNARRRLILGAGVALSVYVDVVIFRTQPTDMSDWFLVALWLVSMLLLLTACVPAPDWNRLGRISRLRVDPATLARSEATWFVLILALGAATRLIYPTLIFPVTGDEGYDRALSSIFVGGSNPNLFGIDFLDTSYMYFATQHLFYLLFGDGLAQARFSVGLMGVALIPPVYLLARELFGTRAAVIASLLLTVQPLDLNYARVNLPQMWALTFTVVFLYCLIRGLRTGKLVWWIAAGIATGVALYGHTDARFIPFMAAAILVYELIRSPRNLVSQWMNVAWFALACLLGYGPTCFNVIHNPSSWTTHSNTMNVLASGWLAQQSKAVGLLPTLSSQVSTNLIPLLTQAPPDDQFYPSGALMVPWAVPFAVAGVIRCVLRPFQRAPFILLSWAVIVFVLGGLLVTPAFGSQHLIEMVVPLVLFGAVGIDWLTEVLPRIQPALALTIAAILTVSGLYYFFVMYQPISARSGAPEYKNATMTQVGYFVRRVRPDAAVYMFDDNVTNYLGSAQASWLAGDRSDVVDIEPGARRPPLKLEHSGAVFISLPSRVNELTGVKRRYPGGRRTTITGPYLNGYTLAYVYAVGRPYR